MQVGSDLFHRNIGRLTQWLKENGLEQNTIVIFSSDNGGSDGGPGAMLQHNGGLRGRKGTYYEGGVREPYIVRWPAKITAGKSYDHPVSHVDIFATALAASGAKPQSLQPLDGVNLVPHFSAVRTDIPHQTLYWSMEGPSPFHWAIRDGNLKLIYEDIHPETLSDRKNRVADRKLQLYDISSDPNETRDLMESRPEDAKRLQAMHEQFLSVCKPSLYTPEVKARHEAALKARENDPKLQNVKVASGSPGHWTGSGAKGRLNQEGVFPPLPEEK